ITADVEVIDIQDINRAWQRMLKSDVKYRFVIDIASLK
nr:NAD(P)-dependent alcohol dehydrogenase [Citrobacter freundii]